MQATSKTGASLTDPEAVVAIYNTHSDAEDAVRQLQRGGFDMKKLSIVGKGYQTDEQVVGFYNTGDRVKYWGGLGALWGGLFGLLFGVAFFWVPGVGPVLVAGPLIAAIVAGLENAVVVGGLSALGAALFSLGIPKDSVLRYETAIKADKYLVLAHGTAEEVEKAKAILKTTEPADLDEHALTGRQPGAAATA
jgi:hypothetical protein